MTSAIIVAAGKGTRMGPDVDKLFLEVAGCPLVAHTWKRLDSTPGVEEIILVIRQGMQAAFAELGHALACQRPYRLVPGGAERQNSVWNGLQALGPETDIVIIQDGARPCTTVEVILKTVEAARASGAAVAAQRVTDTIKESDGGTRIARTIDRARLWAVQTPQTFQVQVIRAALGTVLEKGLHVTDDTAACELIGQPVTLVESLAPNPKATSRADLPLLETLLRSA
jgi:2-C-methyl-D-erythritol 4-phosphate cytidylyltransferase